MTRGQVPGTVSPQLVVGEPAAKPWRALELYQEQLLICTEAGCQPARLIDISDVIELLPELLMRQDRAGRGHQWRHMAMTQRNDGGTHG